MPNPYTGTDNDPFQEAQHRFLGPEWERYFGSLKGKNVRFVNPSPVAGGTGELRPSDLDTARSNATNAYLNQLTDQGRGEAQQLRQITAGADIAEAQARDVAASQQDREAVDRAMQTGGQPAAPIGQNPDGSYTTMQQAGPPPTVQEQRANVLKMLPGHLQPVYQKQWAAQDAQAAASQTAAKKADTERLALDAKATSAAGGLDPDAVEHTATQYRILGPSGIPTRIGEGDRDKILNEAARQAKALGQSPVQAVQKQAAFKADAGALTKMTTMKSSAESFENKAVAQADLVKDLSDKLDRTSLSLVNAALISGKKATGDETAQLYTNALTTFAAEYAKIMEGSTGSAAGSSDAARKSATDLISKGLSKGQIKSTIEQMQWEMRQTIKGYDTTIDHITERMSGGPADGAAPGQVPSAGAAVEEWGRDASGKLIKKGKG